MELHLFPGDTYDLGLVSMFSGLEGGDEERSIMYHACGGFGKQFNRHQSADDATESVLADSESANIGAGRSKSRAGWHEADEHQR